MPLRILIVDDSAVMRAMVARVVRLSGLPVAELCEAGDGAAGLAVAGDAAAAGRPFDLVLLDVNMPVMDGEAMLRALRAEPATAGVPVVVVSTEGSEARRRALEALGVWFLRKPFRPEQLREVVLRAAPASPDASHAALLCHTPGAAGDHGALDF